MPTKYMKGHVYAANWSVAREKAKKKLGNKIRADSLVVKKARGMPKRKRSSAYSYVAQKK